MSIAVPAESTFPAEALPASASASSTPTVETVSQTMGISRRSFFGATAALATVGMAGAVPESIGNRHDKLVSEIQSQPFERQKGDTKHPERALLENETGKVWIANGSHLSPVNPDDIPPTINACFIDRGLTDYGSSSSKHLKSPHYKPLYDFVAKNKTPMIDVDFVSLGYLKSLGIDGTIMGAEAVAGTGFVLTSFKDRKIRKKAATKEVENVSEEIMERRSMLERTLLAATGVHLLSPLASMLMRNFSMETGLGINTTASVNRLMSASHQEIGNFVTHVRDIVIALKLQYLTEKLYKESGKKQHIVGFMGGNHMVEDRLQDPPTENLNALLKYADIFRDLSMHGADSFHSIHYDEFVSRGAFRRTSTYEIPELKQLLDEARNKQ